MFYKILNFLKLPEHLINDLLESVKNPLNVNPKKHQDHVGFKEFKTRKLTKADGETIISVTTDYYKIGESLDYWLKTHVHSSPRRQHISLYNSASSAMGPHVDSDRNNVWLYIINPGGRKVETVWYQELDHEIVRPDLQNISTDYMKGAICDYRKLIEIERYQIPDRTWVEINSSIIHSVEGLETNRLAIQITP